MPPRDILVLTPTPQEFAGVSRRLGEAEFRHLRVRVVESGPGAVNAAFKTAEAALAGRRPPDFLVGAGTCGSLSRALAGGEMIVSAEAVIADWLMEDDDRRAYAPYGLFNYQPLSAAAVEAMTIRCADPLVAELLKVLEGRGFRSGRMMTSGVFVAGLRNKLAKGRDFQALGCDMESGVFAYAAQRLLGRPWFNLRVVADTLDDTLDDYFTKEADMTDILGVHAVLALSALDELWGRFGSETRG